MKKKVIHFVQYALIKILFFGAVYPLHAQISNPSSWESFVGSDENRLVSDTFRLQTFGDSEWDNWEYTTSGATQIQDISSVNIDKLGGKMGLRMSLGSRINFMQYTPTLYTDVKAEIFFGGRYLNKGNNLSIRIYREDESPVSPLFSVSKDNTSCKYDLLSITRTPLRFDLFSASSSSNTEGYYCLQYAFAYGDIPSYSLFSGMGNWNDTILWSHLPPLRHRNALIKGDVTITTDSYCKDIAIHSGSLKINPGNRFILQDLDLYENKAYLNSEGTILLSGCVTLHKTFEESGKWYFISFPFDVFASGIDPDFQLGDDKSDTNGNYFYVQTYNGEKRANSQSPSNNWEVIPQTIINTSQPIFKKNKGYLIAIDASADRQNLRFSSKAGDIPIDFGKNGQASIPVSINNQSQNQNHNGWYLCGNPLPAPLSLSQIESNSALDGYIYIYDGSTYQPYVIGSDFAIPPFSAFFVKANKSTSLSVYNTSEPAYYKLLSTNAPISFPTSEPQARQDSPVSNQVFSFPELSYQLENKTLFITNLPSPGKVELFTPAGILVFTQAVQAGNPILPIPLPQGLEILINQTEHNRAQYKFVLTSKSPKQSYIFALFLE